MGLPDSARPAGGTEAGQSTRARALLVGRVTSTGRFVGLGVVLALACVVLPTLLVSLAAIGPDSGPGADTARPAQLIWAGCLFAVGVLVAWSVGRSCTVVGPAGIRRRWGWSTVTVSWARVSGYAAAAGRRPGVWVLRAGEAPLRVPTPWHTMSFGAAQEAADELNRAAGVVPPPTWGAAVRSADGPRSRPLEEGNSDPELRRILSGNVLWSRGGIVTALLLASLGLLLPGILCALAAAPASTDTSRPAQVAWAVCLFVSYAVLVALAGGSGVSVSDDGIKARFCGRMRRVRWPDVQAFLPDSAGVIVLTRAGQRVRAPVRLGTKAGRERSAREAAYLNGTFGLSVSLRQCDNCLEQFIEARPAGCHFHPAPPVPLGTLGENDRRRSWWMYQCCWLVVTSAMGDDGRELSPPLSGGCRTGVHVAPDWVVPLEPLVSPVDSSLRSWTRLSPLYDG